MPSGNGFALACRNLDHAYFSALHSIVAHNMEFEGFDSILDQPIWFNYNEFEFLVPFQYCLKVNCFNEQYPKKRWYLLRMYLKFVRYY